MTNSVHQGGKTGSNRRSFLKGARSRRVPQQWAQVFSKEGYMLPIMAKMKTGVEGSHGATRHC